MKLWIALCDAAADAKKLGLHHTNFGWYADAEGNVTHRSVKGKLVKIKFKDGQMLAKPEARGWLTKKLSALGEWLGDRRWGGDKHFVGSDTQFGEYRGWDDHVKKFMKWAKKQNPLNRKLTKGEHDSLMEYKLGDFRAINLRLRGSGVPGKLDNASADKHIANIDSALKASTLRESTYAYRGLSLPEGAFKKNPMELVGTSILDKGYTSVSTNPRVAAGFSGMGDAERSVLVHMTLPQGAHALPLARATIGENPVAEESEILCPRNMRLVITKVIKVPKSDWTPACVMFAIPKFE